MKYIIRVIGIFIFTTLILSSKILAMDLSVLSAQQEELNISSFIKETKKYTKEVLEDEDIGDIFSSALVGKIDNNKIISKVLKIFGKEIKEAITVLRKYTSNNYYS